MEGPLLVREKLQPSWKPRAGGNGTAALGAADPQFLKWSSRMGGSLNDPDAVKLARLVGSTRDRKHGGCTQQAVCAEGPPRSEIQ